MSEISPSASWSVGAGENSGHVLDGDEVRLYLPDGFDDCRETVPFVVRAEPFTLD
ncbi:hypothetical protein NDA03_27255 [Trichocoleus sp. Lan]|uniref:hypothetical protein n=1 Tax=Trichocoleus sp. Lan TaxID=2933927 RepID=UPI00329985E7